MEAPHRSDFHSPLAPLGREAFFETIHPAVRAARRLRRKHQVSSSGPSGRGRERFGDVLAQREGFERVFIGRTALWTTRSVVRFLHVNGDCRYSVAPCWREWAKRAVAG